MAKAIRPIVGGVTKTAKKMYAIVGGVTRKVKKVYVIVGGVTRLAWSGGVSALTPVANATSLQTIRAGHFAFGNDAYLLFSGGNINGYSDARSDAFNVNLVKTTLETVGYLEMRVASTPNRAFIAGGRELRGGSLGTIYNTSYSYDKSLVRTSHYLSYGRTAHSSASTASYAMFYGGQTSSSSSSSATETMESFHLSTMTKTNISMGQNRLAHSGCGMGDKAIFVGGGTRPTSSSNISYCTAITDTLVEFSAGDCTAMNYSSAPSGAYNGKYAIFPVSGDTFNASLVKTSITGLNNVYGAISLGDGLSVFPSRMQTIVINQDLVQVITTNPLTYGVQTGGRIGDYVLTSSSQGGASTVPCYKLT